MIDWMKRLRPRRAPVDPRTRTLVIGLGAMKSGTSWLSDHLGRHPDFLHSPIKEMNFFNQLADNPFRWRDDSLRLFRMEEIVLAKRWFYDRRSLDRLRALAQIGRITTPADYLAYFAERMDRQTHFGEISPAYALLPVETLRLMAGLTGDVRFLFLMRDPARRAASHLRHLRRRKRAGVPLDDLLAEVAPGHPVWLRSDYGRTIDLLEAAGVLPQSHLMVYESLFDAQTTGALSDWLGLSPIETRPETRFNVGRGEDLTPDQLAGLRAKLEPIYADLRTRALPDAASAWWWN